MLIKNIDILPMTQEGKILEGYDLLIKDNKIEKIGKNLADRDATILDGDGKIVIPGLINTHTHLAMSLMRNYADDLNLSDWLNNEIFPLEAKLTKEDIYHASKLSMLEMIKSGTTSFVDMYMEMDRVCDAAIEVGMRGVITPGFTSFGDVDQRIKDLKDLHKTYNDKDSLIKIAVAPHSIYLVKEEHLKLLKELAEELDCLIHIHVSETETEVENCIKEHGMRPVEYLDKLGLFERPTIAAHCVHLSDEEIDIFAKKGVFVSHNPSSNLKLASGMARIKDMQDKGIKITIGTDGSSSNNDLNMVEEIHLASLLAKGLSKDPTAMNAYKTLEAATKTAARAIGHDNLGTIEEGMLADLAIIDLSGLHNQPINNKISALVYSLQASDVDSVIINGKLLMKDRKLIGVDEDFEISEARARIKRLKEEK